MALFNTGGKIAIVNVTCDVAKNLDDMAARFEKMGAGFSVASRALSPEFGAYMSYSIYLELGHGVVGNLPSDVRMGMMGGKARRGTKTHVLARPHIVPAVQNNASWIVLTLGKEWRSIITSLYKNPSLSIEKSVAKSWIRVLNDRPRRDATKTEKQGGNCPYEFGFHRRSIRGYAVSRSASEVQSEQREKLLQRKAMAKKKR